MMGATSGGYAYPVPSPGQTIIHAKTIFDLLQAAGISWKIYVQNQYGYSYPNASKGSRAVANTGNVVPDPTFSQFIADAQAGKLPAVVFLEKPDADEKPGATDNLQYGVAETRQLINAVMYGPSWKDSVMIFTFDEGGGMYDHVAPPTNVPSPDGIPPKDICTSATDPRCGAASASHTAPPYDPPGDFTRYGFRVPVVVISPFTRDTFLIYQPIPQHG